VLRAFGFAARSRGRELGAAARRGGSAW